MALSLVMIFKQQSTFSVFQHGLQNTDLSLSFTSCFFGILHLHVAVGGDLFYMLL